MIDVEMESNPLPVDTHEFKEVFLICGKKRGKDSVDRLGTMCY